MYFYHKNKCNDPFIIRPNIRKTVFYKHLLNQITSMLPCYGSTSKKIIFENQPYIYIIRNFPCTAHYFFQLLTLCSHLSLILTQHYHLSPLNLMEKSPLANLIIIHCKHLFKGCVRIEIILLYGEFSFINA